MAVKLLKEHHLEFLSLKEATQARVSLYLSNSTLSRHYVLLFKPVSSRYKLACACSEDSNQSGHPQYGQSPKVSEEYDQEIPQSHTADQPTAP